MSSRPLISVLMVTYNRRDDVKKCITSLLPQADRNIEVLIIDNASTDGTPDMIRRLAPDFRLTCWDENRGLAPALKQLANMAQGEWLFFLDSDTILPGNAITRLHSLASANPRLGAAAPRMKDMDGKIQMTARLFPSPMNGLFGRQTLLSRIWPHNPVTQKFLQCKAQASNRPFRCDWTAFAAVLIRRKALIQAGSIDDSYFVYWVDTDFFKRLNDCGWEVWCFPEIEVIHLEHNKPDRKRSPLAIKDFHIGALRYYYKNHGLYGLNPLLWVAAAALISRMFLHLCLNYVRK